jgi:hypothetical protein
MGFAGRLGVFRAADQEIVPVIADALFQRLDGFSVRLLGSVMSLQVTTAPTTVSPSRFG